MIFKRIKKLESKVNILENEISRLNDKLAEFVYNKRESDEKEAKYQEELNMYLRSRESDYDE